MDPKQANDRRKAPHERRLAPVTLSVSPSDVDLFRRWRDGDLSAFESLMRKHFRRVWAAALAITGDPDEAEDVCQDAFVRCWERRDQCRHPERFTAWLLTIARSVAYNYIQRERSRKKEPLLPESVPSRQTSDRRTEAGDLRRVLLQGMATLSETQRTVLALRDIEGFAHSEIARDPGISETMSRRHLSDARKKMRDYLTQTEQDGE